MTGPSAQEAISDGDDGVNRSARTESSAASDALEPPSIFLPRSVRLKVAVDAVRQGRSVSDAAFDKIYPHRVRRRSSQYWTPVEVARRAAALLVDRPGMRILDVGSGAGKFCLVGALTSSANFTGIEQRRDLVAVATAVAHAHGVGVKYLSGVIQNLDWKNFDAFYFFNPFAENYFIDDERFDDTVELSRARYDSDLRFVAEQLERLPVGTRVATYHGLGRPLPARYVRLSKELVGTDALELWTKV